MKYLKYSDIDLLPNYSDLYSRADADTSINFLGTKFMLPIVPANMQSVIDMDLARNMSEDGYFYIMHRFGNSLRDVVVRTIEVRVYEIFFALWDGGLQSWILDLCLAW